jgi:hypothetical protein
MLGAVRRIDYLLQELENREIQLEEQASYLRQLERFVWRQVVQRDRCLKQIDLLSPPPQPSFRSFRPKSASVKEHQALTTPVLDLAPTLVPPRDTDGALKERKAPSQTGSQLSSLSAATPTADPSRTPTKGSGTSGYRPP